MSFKISSSKGVLAMDFSRCLRPQRFLSVAAGVALVCLFSCLDTIADAIKYPYVNGFASIYELEEMLVFDRYKPLLIAVLCALYSTSYAADQSCAYLRMILSRTSLRSYAFSRIISTVVCVTLASMLGFCLAALLMSPVMSLYTSEKATVIAPCAEDFVSSGFSAFLYLLLLGANFGLAASALSIAGMWVCVHEPESYVAVGSAVILFYFLYSVSQLVPSAFSFDVISACFTEIGLWESWDLSLAGMIAYHAVFLFAFILIFSTGFYLALKRRQKKGALV